MRNLLQFTLDLFDAPVPPTAPPVPAPADSAAPPAIPLADAMSPASFVHPRATRELKLGNARVAYEFNRGKRRTIGFIVGAEGLTVRAPRWVPLRDVDAAVKEKADWILRKLAETRQRHAKLEAARIEWHDGVSFPFLGEPVVVQLDPHHGFEGLADAPGAAHLHRAPGSLRTAPGRDLAKADPVERIDALGQRQRRRRDPPALAPGAFPDAGDRLRGRPRAGPFARDGPQPALLGNGGDRGAGLRRLAAAAQGPAGSQVVMAFGVRGYRACVTPPSTTSVDPIT
jgi:hypothetical protein